MSASASPAPAMHDNPRQDGVVIAVFAPLGRDASLLCATLRQAGFDCVTCEGGEDLIRKLQAGVGGLVLTNEALEQADVRAVGAAIRAQPPWSDLPVLYLSGAGALHGPDLIVQELGNVVVIDRPTSPETIVAAVTSCVRARRRQYAFRDLLQKSEEQRKEIATLNERLVRSMRETHHRVKNNLQVVAALVDLRCMDGPEELSLDEMRRIGSHVRTLAVVHDILTAQTREDPTATCVSSKDILESLLPNIQATAPAGMISYFVDDVPLTVRQATALSLVVFELITNAIKHGKNRAELRLLASAREAALVVADDGPGFPVGFDPVASAHTGLELVENISRWDLCGASRYNTTAAGGEVRITFPLTASG